MLDDSRFAALADEMLMALLDAVEAADPENTEADLENGILEIERDGVGQYIVNKHAPLRQIWMSSPISGAHHFGYDDDKGDWFDTRGDHDTLINILAGELGAAVATAFTVDRG